MNILGKNEKNNQDITNGIYRFELQESSSSSGIFTGTMEYTIANQLNQFDANTIKSLRPISDDVKFFVNQRLIDENGIIVAKNLRGLELHKQLDMHVKSL